ncbi:MAG TPA: LLM class flavin-dependent oxidoreductase [Blastocatellia bacterium]|nr:LLM class flavin-dependent oxidoreductase [Blastocatellia bacterium]
MGRVKEFGIGLEHPHAKGFIGYARMAEELGYKSFWVPEDPFFRGGFSLASAIAASTTSIRIGIGIINPYTRHPALTAMEYGALEEVSDGRSILALGASFKSYIEGQLNIPYVKPGTAIRETVEIIRRFFRGEQVSFEGRLFKVQGGRFNFQPPRAEVPIHLGVLGPKNLELAGEIADGVLLSVMTCPGYARFALDHVKQGAARAGRSLDDFEVGAYLLISVSEDGQSARDAVRPFLAMMISLLPLSGIFDHPMLSLAGVEPAHLQRFAASFSKGELPVALVEDWMIDQFAIAGTPDHCREALSNIVEAGVTHPIAFEIHGTNPEKTIRDVHEHLMPHFL